MTKKQIVTRNASTGSATVPVFISMPALPDWPEMGGAHRAETAPSGRIIRRAAIHRPRSRADEAIEVIRSMHREARK